MVTKKEKIIFALLLVAMLLSLTYGYFLIKKDTPDNCWSHYQTEDQAILNCEGNGD